MTRARSVAASVVALGLTGVVIGPSTAFAVSPSGAVAPPASAAPAKGTPTQGTATQGTATKGTARNAPGVCERPEHYAAQSAAEFLRIDRLDLLSAGKPASRRTTPSGTAEAGSPSVQRPGEPGGDRPDSVLGNTGLGNTGLGNTGLGDAGLGDVGLGDARTVVIADGPVRSAGAARTLDGKVAGSTERGDMAIQKTPPVSPRADIRRTVSKRFGPIQVGDGNLSARAVWTPGMACGRAAGETSSASTGISRITIAGGGSAALLRVPEKVTSRSATAFQLRGGVPQSVGSATITAGRISLVDNEVRLRILRAPELRASMAANGQSRVEYRPPIVEVVGKDGKKNRLSTIGDHLDVTLSDDIRMLEALPPHLVPIGDPPLPKLSGLPVLEGTETTPVPAGNAASALRITLGGVRQATRNNAIAARATAIRVTVMRNVDGLRGSATGSSSDMVADFGIGVLTAAAVVPGTRVTGRSPARSDRVAPGTASGKAAGTMPGRRVSSGWGSASGQIAGTGDGSGPGRSVASGSGDGRSGRAAPTGGYPSDRSGGSDGGRATGPDVALGEHGRSSEDGNSGGNVSFGGSSSFGGNETDTTGAEGVLRSAAMPITGPRVVSLLLAGLALIGAGAAAVYLAARRRKRS